MTARLLSGFFLLLCSCQEPIALPDISYDDRLGSATTMDIYLPSDEGAGRPAVLFIHGGSWTSGSKIAFTGAAKRLARDGYVTATINYRLAQDSAFPATIQDCFCALSFLRANADQFGVDPARVAVFGYSAGGHLVSLLGVAAQESGLAPDCASGPTGPPDAVISGAGVHDLIPFATARGARELVDGTLEEVFENYTLASPLTHVAPAAPPYLLIHGTRDLFVGVDQSLEMREALIASGNDARLLTIAGGGHIFAPAPDQGGRDLGVMTDNPLAWQAAIDFLSETIGRP